MPSRRGSLALTVALALVSLPLVAAGANRIADAAARRVAGALHGVARVLTPAVDREPTWVFVEPEAASASDTALESADVAPATKPGRKAPPAKGVRVRADVVLALANAGVRPMGIPVPAEGARPAGLALVGVSGLGVGLVDGDVLTHASGRPALRSGDVIGAVLGARARRMPKISGRFWRKGESWNLIVEQPYLGPQKPASNPAEPAAELGPIARRGM